MSRQSAFLVQILPLGAHLKGKRGSTHADGLDALAEFNECQKSSESLKTANPCQILRGVLIIGFIPEYQCGCN